MAEHGGGIAQTKVRVLMTVSIGEGYTFSFLNEKWKSCVPVHHPVHGNAAQPVARGRLRKCLGLSVALNEEVALSFTHGAYGIFRNCYTHDTLDKVDDVSTLAGQEGHKQPPAGFQVLVARSEAYPAKCFEARKSSHLSKRDFNKWPTP